MFLSIASAAALALLVGWSNVAQAGGGCPEGYTPQDGVCKPYYGPNVPYGYRYGYGYGDRYRYEKPCPEGFTLQGGRCKPYRGPHVPYYYYR